MDASVLTTVAAILVSATTIGGGLWHLSSQLSRMSEQIQDLSRRVGQLERRREDHGR